MMLPALTAHMTCKSSCATTFTSSGVEEANNGVLPLVPSLDAQALMLHPHRL